MDDDRFDALTRSLSGTGSSRRRLLTGAAGSTFAALAAALDVSDAGATHFVCQHVNKPCTRDGQCCSSRCRGLVGSKTCRAHDARSCTAAKNFCKTGLEGCSGTCFCLRTIGGANFCALNGTGTACTTDRQCVKALGDPRAACFDATGCTTGGQRCAVPCP